MKDDRVAQNIRMRRTVLRLTQEQLETATRICQSRLSRFEHNIRIPTLLEAEQLAKALQCSVLDLLDPGVRGGTITISYTPPGGAVQGA